MKCVLPCGSLWGANQTRTFRLPPKFPRLSGSWEHSTRTGGPPARLQMIGSAKSLEVGSWEAHFSKSARSGAPPVCFSANDLQAWRYANADMGHPPGGPLKPGVVSSPMTWFTKRPGTSFTVSLEKTRSAASDRRSSIAGCRGRVPAPGSGSNTPEPGAPGSPTGSARHSKLG